MKKGQNKILNIKIAIIMIIAVFAWVIIGYFNSTFSIYATALFLPILFSIVSLHVGNTLSKYFFTFLSFSLILIHDYLFRIFGGGIHDDAGRGICEIVFITTLIISTIALIIISAYNYSKQYTLDSNVKLVNLMLEILFILIVSTFSLIFFRNFNTLI